MAACVCACLPPCWSPTASHLSGCSTLKLSAHVRKTLYYCKFTGWHARLAKVDWNTVETCAFSVSFTSVVIENGRLWSRDDWMSCLTGTLVGVSTAELTTRGQLTPVNWWTDAVVRSRPRTPRCSMTPSLTSRVPPPWSTRGRTSRHQPCHVVVVAAREAVAVNDARPHRRRAETTSAAAAARWLLRRSRRVCCRRLVPCCGRICVFFSFTFSWGRPCYII